MVTALVWAVVSIVAVFVYLTLGLALSLVAWRHFNPFLHDHVVIAWPMMLAWPIMFPLMLVGHTTDEGHCWRCKWNKWRENRSRALGTDSPPEKPVGAGLAEGLIRDGMAAMEDMIAPFQASLDRPTLERAIEVVRQAGEKAVEDYSIPEVIAALEQLRDDAETTP